MKKENEVVREIKADEQRDSLIDEYIQAEIEFQEAEAFCWEFLQYQADKYRGKGKEKK